ncbi:hypothetical protein FQZ97_815210 [compost metagenome]
MADQIHLAGIILFGHSRPIPHLNGKASLPKTLGKCELYALGFSLHVGPTGVYPPKVIDSRRQVVLLRANPRELKAIASDFVKGLLVQARRRHTGLLLQLLG